MSPALQANSLPPSHRGSLLAATCGIQFPDQGLNLGPLHSEHRVLAAGPPENSLWTFSHCPSAALLVSPLSKSHQAFEVRCDCYLLFKLCLIFQAEGDAVSISALYRPPYYLRCICSPSPTTVRLRPPAPPMACETLNGELEKKQSQRGARGGLVSQALGAELWAWGGGWGGGGATPGPCCRRLPAQSTISADA